MAEAKVVDAIKEEEKTIGNVQWVHKDINKMKMDLNIQDFITYCNIISSFNKKEVCDSNG